jgi:signal transduction histidine kinase
VSAAAEQRWRGKITLAVRDDGVGFEETTPQNGQMGLSRMQERARSIKASLDIRTMPGQGTEVTATWEGTGATKVRGKRHERRSASD